MAEDFRSFAISDGKKKFNSSPKKVSFFRKIWNFLKALFGNKTYEQLRQEEMAGLTINDLFSRLYQGEIHQYSPSLTNVVFGELYSKKGIQLANKDQFLSLEESLLIGESLESIVTSNFEHYGDSLMLLTGNHWFDTNYSLLKGYIPHYIQSHTLSDYQRQLFQTALDNWEETVRFIKRNNEYASDGTFQYIEETADGSYVTTTQEGDDSSSEQTRDNVFDRSGMEKDLFHSMDSKLKFIIRQVQDVDRNGTKLENAMGVPKLAPFDRTFKRLKSALEGSVNFDDFVARLDEAGKKFPELMQFKRLLGPLNQKLDIHDKHSRAASNAWSAAWQAFNKSAVEMKEVVVKHKSSDHKVRSNDPQQKAIMDRWRAVFQTLRGIPEEYTKDKEAFDKYIREHPGVSPGIWNDGENNYIAPGNYAYAFPIPKGFPENEQFILSNIPDPSIYKITDPVAVAINGVYINGKEIVHSSTNAFYKFLDKVAKYETDIINSMVTNPEGNAVSTNTLNNFFTITADALNDKKRFPTYTDLATDKVFGQIYDIRTNPWVRHSLMLNTLFDIYSTDYNRNDEVTRAGTYERRTTHLRKDAYHYQMEIINNLGVNYDDGINPTHLGVSTVDNSKYGKFAQEFVTFNKERYVEQPRHGSKQTSWATRIRIEEFDKANESNAGLHYPEGGYKSVLKGYISDELTRIMWLRKDGIGSNIPGYNERGKNFIAMYDVLPIDLQNRLIAHAVKKPRKYYMFGFGAIEEMDHYDGIIKDFDKEVDEAIDKYVDSLTNQNKAFLGSYYQVTITNAKDAVDMYNSQKDRIAKMLGVQAKYLDNELRWYSISSWIHRFETSKMQYGDPAFYVVEKEDFHKRVTAFSATGELLRTDGQMQKDINSMERLGAMREAEGWDYREGKPAPEKADDTIVKNRNWDGTFNSAVLKDIDKNSYLYEDLQKLLGNKADPYKKMTEADAQGYITIDSYRIFKKAQGVWTDEMEALYQKMHNGYNMADVEKIQAVKMFPPIKAQYSGPVGSDNLYVPGFHKFSLAPLIPLVIQGTNMEEFNRHLLRNQIDYALFESGSKVGSITNGKGFDSFYKDYENRIPWTKQDWLNNEEGARYTPNKVYLNFMKEQVRIEPRFHDHVVVSTQQRALILAGLFDNGNFVYPQLKGKIDKYIGLVYQYSNVLKNDLMKKLGVSYGNGDYTVEDYRPLVKEMHKQFNQRDLPQHVIDYVDLDNKGKLKNPLDLSTHVQKIETMVFAMVNNQLIKQKTNGDMLVQLASSGFEALGSKVKYSNDLRFYEQNENATVAAQCKIALTGDYLHLLDLYHTDGKPIATRERLNEVIKDKNWLNKHSNRSMVTITGVRIPVQGYNSMEFFEVAEFLPQEAGNVVVVPTEIVAKSGGDFDIDKLVMMKPNIANFNGKVTMFNEGHNRDFGEVKDEYLARISKAKGERDALYEQYRDNKKLVYNDYTYLTENEKTYLSRLASNYHSDIHETTDTIERLQKRIDNSDNGKVALDTATYNTLQAELETSIGKLDSIKADYRKEREAYIDSVMPNHQKDKDQWVKALEEDDRITKKTDEIRSLYSEMYAMKGAQTKAIQNSLMLSIRGILESPEIYKDLVTPNDTSLVKPAADANEGKLGYNPMKMFSGNPELKGKKGKPYPSGTRLFEDRYNLYKQEANIEGKNALAIGANNNKWHTLMLQVGAKLSESLTSKYRLDANFEDGRISFSSAATTDGTSIADLISQLMNGWVDVEKDAWIFNINGGQKVAPTLLFMLQAGTPYQQAVDFLTEPLILRYVDKLRDQDNPFFKAVRSPEIQKNYKKIKQCELLKIEYQTKDGKTDFRKLNALMSYYDQPLDYSNDNHKITFKSKDKTITYQYKINPAKSKLIQFIQLQDLAEKMGDVQKAFKYDTNTVISSYGAFRTKQLLVEAEKTGLFDQETIDKILKNTVIGAFDNQILAANLTRQLLPLRADDRVNKYALANEKNVVQSNKNWEKYGRTVVNDFLLYLYQNRLPDTWKQNFDSLFGNNGIASELNALKGKYPFLEQRWELIKALNLNRSKDGVPINNIKLVGATATKEYTDMLYDEFQQLIDLDSNKITDEDLTQFGANMVTSSYFVTLTPEKLAELKNHAGDLNKMTDLYNAHVEQQLSKLDTLLESTKKLNKKEDSTNPAPDLRWKYNTGVGVLMNYFPLQFTVEGKLAKRMFITKDRGVTPTDIRNVIRDLKNMGLLKIYNQEYIDMLNSKDYTLVDLNSAWINKVERKIWITNGVAQVIEEGSPEHPAEWMHLNMSNYFCKQFLNINRYRMSYSEQREPINMSDNNIQKIKEAYLKDVARERLLLSEINNTITRNKNIDKQLINMNVYETMRKVALFGFAQSGMNKSHLNYTDIIPQEAYTKRMGNTIANLLKTSNWQRLFEEDFFPKFVANNFTMFTDSYKNAIGIRQQTGNFRKKNYISGFKSPKDFVDTTIEVKEAKKAEK